MSDRFEPNDPAVHLLYTCFVKSVFSHVVHMYICTVCILDLAPASILHQDVNPAFSRSAAYCSKLVRIRNAVLNMTSLSPYWLKKSSELSNENKELGLDVAGTKQSVKLWISRCCWNQVGGRDVDSNF